MYLKSLVLKGFKSFADRSMLSFEPGITAVVGPNGSGKSNISDAVLWVLGERNAKNLRGQAMEDVIFSGSSARKSVGVAEVDLVLDNSDGTLPVDYSEVVITRRMYRSGESEYLINGALARRMDVLDILHDSGLGSGTHSIISQGSLDSILQSKPEDLRALIEEAAGVLKHKQRKQRSERKLEAMDGHLARARDVAAEVERQLGPLERKARRAQAYQEISKELAALTLELAVDDLRELQKKWEHTEAEEKSAETHLETLRQSIATAESRVEELQERVRERTMSASSLAQNYRRVTSVLERCEATTMLIREKRRAAAESEMQLAASLQSHSDRLEQAQRDAEAARKQFAQADAAKLQADEELAQLLAQQKSLSEQQSALEAQAREEAAREHALAARLEQCRARQTELSEKASGSTAREALIAEHVQELELQREAAREDCEKAQGALGAKEEALASLKQCAEQAQAAVDEAIAAREQAQAALDEARDALSLANSEKRGLEEAERASESSSPALAWLATHSDTLAAKLQPLAHVISAPQELEPLIERLLGGDLAGQLIESSAEAQSLADALSQSGERGQVVLLPKQDMRPGQAVSRVAAQDGSQDGSSEMQAASSDLSAHLAEARRLIDELSYPDDCARAVESLLGDIYVCTSHKEAISAHKVDVASPSGARWRFVTPDGFCVWQSGKMVLGTPADDDVEGALARHRRIEELAKLSDRSREQQEAAQQTLASSEEALRAAREESLQLSQECAQREGELVSLRQELVRTQEKLAAFDRELASLADQREEAQQVLGQTKPELEALVEQIAALEQEIVQAKEASRTAQQELAPLQEQAQALSEDFSNARLKAATAQERRSYAERMLASREREIAALLGQEEASKKELATRSLVQRRSEPLISCLEALAESARSWSKRLEEQTLASQDSSNDLHTAITEARSAAHSLHEAFDKANEALSGIRVEKGRLEVQVESAVNTIVRDCNTPIETALAAEQLADRAATEQQVFKLRRRIANMGTINPDAAAEYELLKARYDYLSKQLSDLKSARSSLSKIVSVIDARMKDDFTQTFEQVNSNFQEIFARLFPGGTAELTLTDPSDPELSAVEVSAQPQGKRITKMMLMSGGEKSLTALALLFAIYRIRSAPFYILDEVEAALDDTNLRRLCTYCDSLRHETQLVMITHQRRTMEMADVLYGVSMQADGVTRVVSQRLDRALRYAE